MLTVIVLNYLCICVIVPAHVVRNLFLMESDDFKHSFLQRWLLNCHSCEILYNHVLFYITDPCRLSITLYMNIPISF